MSEQQERQEQPNRDDCESVLEVDDYKFRCDLESLHGGDHIHEFMSMAGPPRRLHFAKLEWWHA